MSSNPIIDSAFYELEISMIDYDSIRIDNLYGNGTVVKALIKDGQFSFTNGIGTLCGNRLVIETNFTFSGTLGRVNFAGRTKTALFCFSHSIVGKKRED